MVGWCGIMKIVCVLMVTTMLSCFGVDWKISEIEGVEFVSLEQVGELYGLERMKKRGFIGVIVLETKEGWELTVEKKLKMAAAEKESR